MWYASRRILEVCCIGHDRTIKRTERLHSLDKLTCGVVLGAQPRLAANPDHYRSPSCSPERFGELESAGGDEVVTISKNVVDLQGFRKGHVLS
jgi:hypothetical protein